MLHLEAMQHVHCSLNMTMLKKKVCESLISHTEQDISSLQMTAYQTLNSHILKLRSNISLNTNIQKHVKAIFTLGLPQGEEEKQHMYQRDRKQATGL